jgi:hypothetical protein
MANPTGGPPEGSKDYGAGKGKVRPLAKCEPSNVKATPTGSAQGHTDGSGAAYRDPSER